MAVFRVERTRDYTVMSNFHLKDKRLSLKAKGLLSQMLSLPDDWDYTLAGLSQINRESKDAIRSAVNELEKAGYIVRHQTIDRAGQFGANEYCIYERPRKTPPSSGKPSPGKPSSEDPSPESPSSGDPSPGKPSSGDPSSGDPSSGNPSSENPSSENPLSENPTTDNPSTDNPSTGNPTQLSTKKPSTKKQSKKRSNIESYPSDHNNGDSKRSDAISPEIIEIYQDIIRGNIDYDILKERTSSPDELDEIVSLLTETVCFQKPTVRIAGTEMPFEIVKSVFLKLNANHIEYVLDSMHQNTTRVRNIRQYLLTALYNAPSTINSHSRAQVNYDLNGGDPV